MNMTTQLAVNQAIDEQLNGLLPQMTDLMDRSGVWRSLKASQFQNLMAVTRETGSVEVVKMFILYQVGRDNRSQTWGLRIGNQSFGEALVAEIDRLKSIAQSVLADAAADQSALDATWMRLTQLYLGNMTRYFYFKERGSQ